MKKLNVVVELVLDGGMGPLRLDVVVSAAAAAAAVLPVMVVEDEATTIGAAVTASGLVRLVGVFGLLLLLLLPLMVASALFMSSYETAWVDRLK